MGGGGGVPMQLASQAYHPWYPYSLCNFRCAMQPMQNIPFVFMSLLVILSMFLLNKEDDMINQTHFMVRPRSTVL